MKPCRPRQLVYSGEERDVIIDGIWRTVQVHVDPKTKQEFAVQPRGTEVADVFIVEEIFRAGNEKI